MASETYNFAYGSLILLPLLPPLLTIFKICSAITVKSCLVLIRVSFNRVVTSRFYLSISKYLHLLARADTKIVMKITFPKISKLIYEQTKKFITENLQYNAIRSFHIRKHIFACLFSVYNIIQLYVI